MQQNITPKQLEIVNLLYKYRFLNRIQLQKFLHHKDTKRINIWLKDLTQKNIVGRKYSPKLKENTKPAIYHLATKSRKILLSQEKINPKLLKRVYSEKSRSQKLIDHSILLADIYFLVKDQADSDKRELQFVTKTDLTSHFYLPNDRPDAYIAISSKRKTSRYFLEIIDPETPRFILRKKILDYIEYFDESSWKEATGHPNPSVLLICPNLTIHAFLHKFINQDVDEDDLNIQFYLTTKDIIQFG